MAKQQKRATPTKEQRAAIRASGRNPDNWTVVKELRQSLIVRHRTEQIVAVVRK